MSQNNAVYVINREWKLIVKFTSGASVWREQWAVVYEHRLLGYLPLEKRRIVLRHKRVLY